MHVHGVAGIGKSSLLEAFARRTRAQGIRVVRIDCRTVEPTARGLLTELSDALGESLASVEDVAQRLSSFGETVAIVLDTYEVFVLLDAWIRQVFVPSLPVNARLAIGSRNPPSPAWRTTPGWQGLFRSLPLDPLPETDALRYLALSGIPVDVARRINGVAHGHPLALSMSASIALSDPGRRIEDTSLHQVIDQLSRSYIEAVPDAITKQALEASAVVRCVTEPLLHALIPDIAPRDAMERLGALPFVDLGARGVVHPRSCTWRDRQQPGRARPRYASGVPSRGVGLPAEQAAPRARQGTVAPYRRSPVSPREPRPAGGLLSERRATACRRAGDSRPTRRPCCVCVAAKAAPERDALAAWWRYNADGFRVVRDRDRSICGLCIMVRASELHEAVDAADPVAAAWRRDVAARGPSNALFCRRWLDRDVGEAPSASQAASWVDLKRTYMEMRGTLRWVYTAVANPEPYLEWRRNWDSGRCRIRRPTSAVRCCIPFSSTWGRARWTRGWRTWSAQRSRPRNFAHRKCSMSTLVSSCLPSGRVNLTSLEFGVMQYLQDHPGKAVSRYDLMEAVWGYRNDTASNVVDVVVRSLRRKLGVESSAVETVRGTGYRYRMPASTP